MILEFIKGVCFKLAASFAAIFLLKENARLKHEKQDAEDERDYYEHEANSWADKPSGSGTVVRLRDAAARKKKDRS